MIGRLLLLVFLLLTVVASSSAEQVPLTTCDGLPVMQVSMAGMKFSFLVDTAATSILNIKSFDYGEAKKISVTSWRGTSETMGQKVTISDLVVGEHHLRNLTLSAVDLSAIGRACGRPLDGILGIDVLDKLGAVVDLNARVAQLPMDSDTAQSRIAELDARLAGCVGALNRPDEKLFYDCLDPRVVLFTPLGDFYGREAAMNYYQLKGRYPGSAGQISIQPRAHHLLGDAIWVEYDLHAAGEQTIMARGTALCEKTDGRWRIVHLNSSAPPRDAPTSQ